MIDPPLHGVSLDQAPADWQILQAEPDGTTVISLAGVYRVEAPQLRVQARLVRETDGAPVRASLDWADAELLPDQRWRLTLESVPAGGLYRLETRAWRAGCADTRPTRGDCVHHLGVGDLWVIAGQSNASGTGLGSVEDPPTLGVHLFGNDEQWKLATHPLEDATRTRHPITVHGVFQGHAPWLAFARVLWQTTGRPIGLIPTALGGSPLAMWEKRRDGALYANCLDMVRLAGGRVRGVVWYQGESDCSEALAQDYLARFAGFVADLRADLGDPALPVLTAQLAGCTAPGHRVNDRWWTAIREAQRQAALTVPGVALVPATDLPMSDEIHVSAVGNVTLGRRFAASALRHVYGVDVPEPGIALREVAWQALDPPTLRLSFDPASAGWAYKGDIGDVSVVDEDGELPLAAVVPDDAGWVDVVLGRPPEGAATLHLHAGAAPVVRLTDRDQRPVLAASVALPPRVGERPRGG